MSQTPSFSILGGNGCPELGKRVAKLLKCDYNNSTSNPKLNNTTSVKQFNNGETNVVIQSVRNTKTVYIIQSFGANEVNNKLMELMLLAGACKNNGAREIIVVCPCFGYARQDRTKLGDRQPASAQIVSNMLQMECVNIDSLYVMDIHCEQLQCAFNRTRFQNLGVAPIFAKKVADYVTSTFGPESDICIVAPDHGATARNKEFKEHFECYYKHETTFAVIDKKRAEAGVVEEMMLTTGVPIKGRIIVIVDDIADTCGTLGKAAEVLMSRGAKAVIAVITHPVLSGNANQKIEQSPFTAVFVSDSIPLPENASDKFKVVSIDSLIATVIQNLESKTDRVLSDIYEVGVLEHIPFNMSESQYNFNKMFGKSETNAKNRLADKLVNEKNMQDIMTIDNLHIGVLSGNEQKMCAIQNLNKTWKLINVMPATYVPFTEQPIGHRMTRKCLQHRYDNCNKSMLWGTDIVIGIESGLAFNGKIGEITQIAIFTNTAICYLKPHVIHSKKNIKHHIESILNTYQESSDEACVKDIGETKDIMDILSNLQKNPNAGFTFGQWLHDKFGDDAQNWHSRFFEKNRTQLIHESLRNTFEKQKEYDIIKDRCQLRGMLSAIEVYPNFPQDGVDFQNMYPLFRKPAINKAIIDNVVNICKFYNIDTICAVSSRGYLIGPTVAYLLGIPLVVITKPGKLPEDKVIIKTYKKEYGPPDSLQLEIGSINGTNIMIIDDVLATGGSLECCLELVETDLLHYPNVTLEVFAKKVEGTIVESTKLVRQEYNSKGIVVPVPITIRALTLSHVSELTTSASDKLGKFDSVDVVF